MEKINIAELLKDCPKGMELYSPIFGKVYLDKVRPHLAIVVITDKGQGDFKEEFLYDGRYGMDGECMLYPSKSKTTWEGFVPPCKFKDGDILVNKRGSMFIYKGPMYYNKNLADYYCGYRISDHALVFKKFKDSHFGDINELRLASEIEKLQFFQIILDNGYKWNPKTKTLEKLFTHNIGTKVWVKSDADQRIKIDIPDGYEFFGVDDDSKIVLTKKQFQYPKTIEECAKVLSTLPHTRNGVSGYSSHTLWKLQQLLICRDAYWKIAGEEMGLGQPWEPEPRTHSKERYVIITDENDILFTTESWSIYRILLEFPTAEMRDTFFENFKVLIEKCKEFL